MDKDTIAIVVSLFSLLISILIAIWQLYVNIKINRVNLKSNVCKKVFEDYLIKKIPHARRLLKFDAEGKLTGVEELKNIIVDMIKDSLYYRYNDKSFYDELVKNLQELEDALIVGLDKSFDSVGQCDFNNRVEIILAEVYRIIENKTIKG